MNRPNFATAPPPNNIATQVAIAPTILKRNQVKKRQMVRRTMNDHQRSPYGGIMARRYGE